MDTIRKVFQTLPYLFCLIAVLNQIQDFVAGWIANCLYLYFQLAPSEEEAGYSSYLKWRGNGILIKHAQLQ